VPAPFVIIHGLVPSGADPNCKSFWSLGPRKHCRNPIGTFHPEICGIEHLRAGTKAMENLTEKPFTRIGATALGEVLGANTSRQFRYLRSLGSASMILPEPGHSCRVSGKRAVQG